jgi:probable F420-dependent oxidoreductase
MGPYMCSTGYQTDVLPKAARLTRGAHEGMPTARIRDDEEAVEGRRLSFGLIAGAGNSRASMEELASGGFDSLWVGGHVASPNPVPEVITSLVRLAAQTDRVRIGTAVLVLPLYAPGVLAKQLAEVDRMSGGRLIVGVGAGGEYAEEFRLCGIPPSERFTRTDEGMVLLRELWSGRTVSHSGRHYPMTDVRIDPEPVQPGGPPLIVGGRRQKAMRRAALLGDGWLPYLFSAERYHESVEQITRTALEAGRSLDAFQWHAFVFVNVHRDPTTARDEVVEFLGGTYHQDFSHFIDRVAVAGNPHQVGQRLQAYVDAGARHFVFVPASRADHVAVRRHLVSEVLPGLAAR